MSPLLIAARLERRACVSVGQPLYLQVVSMPASATIMWRFVLLVILGARSYSRVSRDGAIRYGQYAAKIENSPAAARCTWAADGVSGDRAAKHSERAGIINTAAVSAEGSVREDRVFSERQRTVVQDAAADSGSDNAVGDREPQNVHVRSGSGGENTEGRRPGSAGHRQQSRARPLDGERAAAIGQNRSV